MKAVLEFDLLREETVWCYHRDRRLYGVAAELEFVRELYNQAFVCDCESNYSSAEFGDNC